MSMKSMLLGVLLIGLGGVAFANQTSITVNGAIGDWVTTGRSYFFTPANATFTANPSDGRNFILTVVAKAAPSPDHDFDWFWRLSFAAPSGQRLEAGTYLDASRFPFQPPDKPGLDVSSIHGCNTSKGSFVVLEAGYDSKGSLVSFWATFTQSCEGGPFISGDVKFNVSEGFAAIPTLGGIGYVILGLAFIGAGAWMTRIR